MDNWSPGTQPSRKAVTCPRGRLDVLWPNQPSDRFRDREKIGVVLAFGPPGCSLAPVCHVASRVISLQRKSAVDLHADEFSLPAAPISGGEESTQPERAEVAALTWQMLQPKCPTGRSVDVLPIDENGDSGRSAAQRKTPRQCGPKAGRRGRMRSGYRRKTSKSAKKARVPGRRASRPEGRRRWRRCPRAARPGSSRASGSRSRPSVPATRRNRRSAPSPPRSGP